MALHYVATGMMGWRFLDDVMAHREDAWNEYLISAGQVDAVLVQLMLLHTCVQCMVDLEFYGDEAEEEVDQRP